jgi:hypothetical protein
VFGRSVDVFRKIGSERDRALTLGDWSHVLRRRGEAGRADELRALAEQTLATLGLPQLAARLDPAPSDRMRASSREEPAW